MTAYQFATLKYLMNHEVTIDQAGQFSMVTFGSLAQRGWIRRVNFSLIVTQNGLDAFNYYAKGDANFRKVDTGLTDRVKSLLHLHRARLAEVKKAS